jgi:hypothetical protein
MPFPIILALINYLDDVVRLSDSEQAARTVLALLRPQ